MSERRSSTIFAFIEQPVSNFVEITVVHTVIVVVLYCYFLQHPENYPLGILNGHNAMIAGSYKHALGKWIKRMKYNNYRKKNFFF